MTNRIKQLQEMGFSEKVARKVLAECVWDVNKAIDRLLQEGAPPDEDEPTNAGPAPGGDADVPTPMSTEAWPAVSEKPVCDMAPGASTTASTASSPRSSGRKEAAAAAAEAAQVAAAPSVVEAEEDTKSTSAGSQDVAGTSSSEDDAAREYLPPDRSSDASETLAAVAEASVVEATVAEPAAPEPAAVEPEPRKLLQRVEKPWQAEDGSQKTVATGDFVRAWLDSSTEEGWIHVEAADGSSVGWLPDFCLQTVPDHKRWMRAAHACEAAHATQMHVEEGNVLLVQVDTRTAEDGWVYAEAPESGDVAKEGWVAVYVLEWEQE